MTALERRKLVCSVTFHIISITCVVWSLYVLIDRTADEIRAGELQWPFWTKLVVVAIGFTGGIVFMYIQCKVYVYLCRKWKAYNRVIVVQDAPEGDPPGFFVSFASLKDPKHDPGPKQKHAGEMVVWTDWSVVERWAGLPSGSRGADYKAFKRKVEDKMFGLFGANFPELAELVVLRELYPHIQLPLVCSRPSLSRQRQHVRLRVGSPM